MAEIPRSRKVVVLGPSTLLYSDTGPEETIMGFLEARLAELAPETRWECVGSVLYFSPSMARRVRDIVDRERPDIVYVRPPAMQLVSDYVVNRIRERWPRLYNSSNTVANFLNTLAGGGPEGGPGIRGLVFRGPRWLLARLIGAAPSLRADEAAAVVRETLDDLLSLENVEVLYGLPSNVVPPNVSKEEADRRLKRFGALVSEYCEARRIPCIDTRQELDRRGVVHRLTDDRWHPDRAGRQADADILAEAILGKHSNADTGG